ncbi:Rho GTPase [Phlyctochytrium bullatum]|nr:Rho GTPase [Phlyctochytrium bullatum]
MTTPPKKKVVCIGDESCGKTALLRAWAGKSFPETHEGTLHEVYVQPSTGDDGVPFEIHDTGGAEDMDRLRATFYEGAELCLVCFSVGSRKSFTQVKEKWAPEARVLMPDAPIILVACKTDLRLDEENGPHVSKPEGQLLARDIKAVKYVETSALSLYQVENLLDESVSDSAAEGQFVLLNNHLPVKSPSRTSLSKPASRRNSQLGPGAGTRTPPPEPSGLLGIPAAPSSTEELVVTARGVVRDGKLQRVSRGGRTPSLASSVTSASASTNLGSPEAVPVESGNQAEAVASPEQGGELEALPAEAAESAEPAPSGEAVEVQQEPTQTAPEDAVQHVEAANVTHDTADEANEPETRHAEDTTHAEGVAVQEAEAGEPPKNENSGEVAPANQIDGGSDEAEGSKAPAETGQSQISDPQPAPASNEVIKPTESAERKATKPSTTGSISQLAPGEDASKTKPKQDDKIVDSVRLESNAVPAAASRPREKEAGQCKCTIL